MSCVGTYDWLCRLDGTKTDDFLVCIKVNNLQITRLCRKLIHVLLHIQSSREIKLCYVQFLIAYKKNLICKNRITFYDFKHLLKVFNFKQNIRVSSIVTKIFSVNTGNFLKIRMISLPKEKTLQNFYELVPFYLLL